MDGATVPVIAGPMVPSIRWVSPVGASGGALATRWRLRWCGALGLVGLRCSLWLRCFWLRRFVWQDPRGRCVAPWPVPRWRWRGTGRGRRRLSPGRGGLDSMAPLSPYGVLNDAIDAVGVRHY